MFSDLRFVVCVVIFPQQMESMFVDLKSRAQYLYCTVVLPWRENDASRSHNVCGGQSTLITCREREGRVHRATDYYMERSDNYSVVQATFCESSYRQTPLLDQPIDFFAMSIPGTCLFIQ